jgi:hypothetical protein
MPFKKQNLPEIKTRRSSCTLDDSEREAKLLEQAKLCARLSKDDRLNNHKKMQRLFLTIYELCEANISATCRILGVKRNFYYNWKVQNPKFAEAVAYIEEGIIDIAENKLVDNIKKGKEVSLLFFLKCKAKHRGYVERQEVDISGKLETTINIIPASKMKAGDNNE